MIDGILYYCKFGLIKKNFYEKTNKKYAEVIRQSDNAV